MKSLDLDLFDNIENYLCKINIPEGISGNSPTEITTIIILDVSGSMYDSIDKITNLFLPELFTKLNYKDNQQITFITFSNDSEIITYDFSEIKKGLYIEANGATYMQPALENLKNFLEKYNINKNIRILTISDGELFDQEETVNYSNQVVNSIKKNNLLVNSQAIRFFTSSSQPDTRGLSSCLQFSNITTPTLIDIKAYNYKYENYENIFNSDGFESKILLKSDEKESLKVEPWDNYTNEIYIRKGLNTFWLKKEIGDKILKGDILLKIDDIKNGKKISLKANLKGNITLNNFQNIISEKIDFYMKKLKVLKVLNSQDSLEEMDKIIDFFQNFENKLIAKEEIKKLDNSLNSRLILISKQIEKRKSSLANKMAQIRNDEKVAQLNSQQQADYLRKIDVNDKNSKALAKRAFISGLDFDEIAKKEVLKISKHISELDGIDESKLNVSFYSTCNTLDGIRTLSQLPKKKEIFDDLTANDIIKLLNIVGIAAYSTVGNYPDPMTYRLEKIYPSTFISISDILTAYEVSNGSNLTEISNKENIISTCIPYFEDEKIHKFLIKYAPHLLELTTSIGMRKIISEVPFTYEYNLLAGYWKMIEVLLKDKSEVNIRTFTNFINNYKIISKPHFEYVIDLVENQKKLPKNIDSLFIANNGITNMTYPLCELVLREKNDIDKKFIQKILRATYQFEVYQYIRKLIRKQPPETTMSFIKDSLIELLNIDIEKNRTKLNPYFESDDNLPIYEDYIPNIELSKSKYLKHIYWLDYIVAVPTLLKGALDEKNPIEEIKKLPDNLLTEEFIKENLGIEYDLDLFRFYCIIQSFLYREKSDRCDSKEKRMLISDLFYDKHFDKITKKFVKNIFQEEFQKDKNKKIKSEIEILKNEIVKQLLNSTTQKDFVKLLNEGIKKGNVEIKIINPDSIGYNDLMNSLLDENIKDIPFRAEKLFILMTGQDNRNVIWNGGNILRDLNKIQKAKQFLSEKLLKKFEEIKKTAIYQYRGGSDMCNRHGHSNDLPSYWAYGYQSVYEMSQNESESFMEDYYKNHIGCCGLGSKGDLSYTKLKKKGKKEGSIGGASYH